MTEEHSQEEILQTEADADTLADAKVVIIVFATAVVMAIHFVSGFTFDF